MHNKDPIEYVTIKDTPSEKFEFCIEGYTRPEDYTDNGDTYPWTDISWRVARNGQISEIDRCESLLDDEVDYIRDSLRKLLSDNMKKPEKAEFAEMDFIFNFNPKSEQQFVTIDIYGYMDIEEIEINLNRDESKRLLNYLEEVTRTTQPLNDTLRSFRE